MRTISIIGAGGMAAAIAERAAKAGHIVEITSRNASKALALADRVPGATVGVYAKIPAGDLVILAVPYGGAAAVVADYGQALSGKVVIDIANPVAPDMSGLVTPAGTSGAQETAKNLPADTRVVKAFNTIFGHVLSGDRTLDAFIAGNDTEAKEKVAEFLKSINLRPLDVGDLAMSQTLEAAGLMMIGLARHGAGTWNFALKVQIDCQTSIATPA